MAHNAIMINCTLVACPAGFAQIGLFSSWWCMVCFCKANSLAIMAIITANRGRSKRAGGLVDIKHGCRNDLINKLSWGDVMAYITVHKAAKLYGISAFSIRQWVKDGLVESWRASEKGRIQIDRAKFETFLSETIGLEIPKDNNREQPTAIEKQFFSIDEAAAMLGVCKQTVYRHCLRGDLPSVKLGKRRLIPVEGLKKQLVNASNVTAFPDKLDYRDVTGGIVCAK